MVDIISILWMRKFRLRRGLEGRDRSLSIRFGRQREDPPSANPSNLTLVISPQLY